MQPQPKSEDSHLIEQELKKRCLAKCLEIISWSEFIKFIII